MIFGMSKDVLLYTYSLLLGSKKFVIQIIAVNEK